MSNIGKGLLAGLAATVVLSALMILKAMMGIIPALDLPAVLAGMMGSLGIPIAGWLVHFFIGLVIYGIAIATLEPRLGLGPLMSGIVLGTVGWVIMMLVLMPMAGAGLFGMSLGIMASVMTLILHLIFGAVLGWVYGRLVAGRTQARTARA